MKFKVDKVYVCTIDGTDIYKYAMKIKVSLFKRWHTITIGDMHIRYIDADKPMLYDYEDDAKNALKSIMSLDKEDIKRIAL